MRPVKPGRAAPRRSRLIAEGSPAAVRVPSRSPVSDVKPKVTVATYVFGHSWTKSASRVALLIRIGRTPPAARASVPPGPAFRTPGSRRNGRTTANDEGPAGLLTFRIPEVTRGRSCAHGLPRALWPPLL